MHTELGTQKGFRVRRFAALGCVAVALIVAIPASMPAGNPQANPQEAAQQKRESVLRKLTPAQAAMVKPFLQRSAPAPGAEIRGFVTASLWEGAELRDTALPHARVFVQTAEGAVDEQTATQTNNQGRFHIPSRAPGVYNICASLNGFTKGCSLVAVLNHNTTMVDPIALKPVGTALRGCVTLKDGTPGVRDAAASYESAGSAEVSAENAAGQIVAGPTAVNAAGCYVLPAVKVAEGLHIIARYEQATERQVIPSGGLDLRNHTAVNVVLPTSPPMIASFTAVLNGKEVSHTQPGSTVTVEVKASSPNHHPLHYKWADSSGRLLAGDQATQQWSLPRAKSLNLIFVEVSDDHGGATRASLSLATGPISVAEQSLLQRFQLVNGGRGAILGKELKAFKHPNNEFIDPKLFMQCADETACKAEASNYYQAIGVFDGSGHPTGSNTSFKAWKTAWGFSDDPTKPTASENRALYYNNGDLQFGRDMHCIDFTGPVDADLVFTGIVINVCYVANYSDASRGAGGDPQISITNAETNTNPIAAVAMINISQQIPIFDAGQFLWLNVPFVEFIVFAPPTQNDPIIDDFVPSTEALLDGEGLKAVPGVCIACHGGTYSTGAHNVSGARFLPFDTPSFLYDQVNSTFSDASQSAQFRTLNIIAKNASTDGGNGFANSITSQTVRDLVDGWYSWCGGVDSINPNCSIDDVNHTFVPSGTCTSAAAPATCGWNTGLNGLFYQQVPRAVCRTCHVAHSDAFNWQNFSQVTSQSQQMCNAVNSYFMPLAQVPYNRFWNSSLDQSSFQAFAGCQSLTPPPQ